MGRPVDRRQTARLNLVVSASSTPVPVTLHLVFTKQTEFHRMYRLLARDKKDSTICLERQCNEKRVSYSLVTVT